MIADWPSGSGVATVGYSIESRTVGASHRLIKTVTNEFGCQIVYMD